MSLSSGDKGALAKVVKLSPGMILMKREVYQGVLSKIDSLQKSLEFFETEYDSKKKEAFIKQIKEDISIEKSKLENTEPLLTIAELTHNVEMKEDIENIILTILNDARQFFQVDNMISNEGLFGLVEVIIEMFASWTIEDVALCVFRAKSGQYGEVYNRLDGPTILRWFNAYEMERVKQIMERNYSSELNHKASNNEERSNTKSLSEIMHMDKTRLLLQRAKAQKRK